MSMRSAICWIWMTAATSLLSQTFNAGSNGSDGDLTFPGAEAGAVIIFNPKDTTLFPGGLDNDSDNVYHFRTIVIPANVTVRLTARTIGGPVTWLAQGAVRIEGTLDVSGEDGAPGGFRAATSAVPGPGGFYGGTGGDTGTRPPSAGFGPAGGALGTGAGCQLWGRPGGFTGNEFLVPLIGGSGGAGYPYGFPQTGPGGGAGGGAILIASSGTITIPSTGRILARGGNVGDANNGAGVGGGGAIRLAAVRIEGNGLLGARGGNNAPNCGNASLGIPGRVRLEAFQHAFAGTIEGNTATGTPFDTFVNVTLPTLRVVSVAGVQVTHPPSGAFEIPDVSINSGGLVPVVIQAANIPAGTVVRLQVWSENGASQTIEFPPLPSNGSATVNVKWPTGFSRGFMRASFTQ